MVRRTLIASIAVIALFAAGCGQKEDVTHEAKTEGIWLDVGPLDYHVQASRALNQYQVPDDVYLRGIPDGTPPPGKDALWFAVFLRIENKTNKPAMPASEFEIEDTLGNVYKPVELDTELNPFAYHPYPLGPDQAIPHPDSAQEFDSVAGSELLFRIPLTNYQNRPLEFKIIQSGITASLDLDV